MSSEHGQKRAVIEVEVLGIFLLTSSFGLRDMLSFHKQPRGCSYSKEVRRNVTLIGSARKVEVLQVARRGESSRLRPTIHRNGWEVILLDLRRVIIEMLIMHSSKQ
jgi:hypothetical protein